MGSALALGAEAGVPVLSLGTPGTVFVTSERPAADPTGVVAGFADATGRFLPLSCTLAVDRVASWLGLDRDDVADRTDALFLPYLDGERTPDLPKASGTLTGLRYTTTRQEILLAAYEGAVASLTYALSALDAHSSGLSSEAPLVLIGGGAQGSAWRRLAARLFGRGLRIPRATELVALGAAAQAASTLVGEPPARITQSWDHGRGEELPPVAQDQHTLERIAQAIDATHGLLAAELSQPTR